MPLINGVFEGGGIRGIGIVGALNSFEAEEYKWNRVAGTSVGSIIAALLIAGYSSKDMRTMISETDPTIFLDRNIVQKIPIIGKLLGIYREKGMYSGEYFESWMDSLLKEKGLTTFKDLYDNGKSRLKIVASDVTTGEKLIIPDDLPKYGISPYSFKISRAVRMSISIPLYFKPLKLSYPRGTSYIVDGGICLNFPFGVFNGEGDEVPTIGFKFLHEDFKGTASGKRDTFSYLRDLANTISKKTAEDFCEDERERIVFIPAYGVDTTEFNISREKAVKLYRDGCESAKIFLKNFNYDLCCEKCCNKGDIA